MDCEPNHQDPSAGTYISQRVRGLEQQLRQTPDFDPLRQDNIIGELNNARARLAYCERQHRGDDRMAYDEMGGWYDEDFHTVGETRRAPGAPGTGFRPGERPGGGAGPGRRAPPGGGGPPRLPPGGGGMSAPPGYGGGYGSPVSEDRARAIVHEVIAERLPAWFQTASAVPGSPSDGQLMSPLGLGTGTLTNAVNVITLQVNPQRPFRGERLLISALRSAAALIVPVRVTDFKIGENSQLVGSGALPVEMFAPDSFGVRLAMSPAQPGVNVNLRLETDVGAVPGGESVVIVAGIVGRAVWSDRG
jgi:hypothetical protein